MARVGVLLAPLRLGAGVKGKIVDAWRCGCLVVTTPVGAEGKSHETQCSYDADGNQFTNETDGSWDGTITSEANEFVDAAVEVYTRKELWKRCQDKGTDLLDQLFNGKINLPVVENSIRDAIISLRQRRRLDVIGAILWQDAWNL